VTPNGLDLQWDRASGEKDTSIEGCATDASYCNTYRYGYFEARMKWDVTTGAWPAFWMITKQGVEGVQHVGELDIFEGQGNDPTHYYGTINEWNGGADLVSTNSPQNNRFDLPSTNDYSQWHTYGLLWLPGTVIWYYDNQPVGRASTPAIFDQQDFFIILSCQEGNHWIYNNLADVTAQSMNLDVQWVHVFQAPSDTAVAVTTALPVGQPLLTSVVPEEVTTGQVNTQAPLPANQILSLTLNLPMQNQTGLNTLLRQISNPNSANYNHFLTADQFNAAYSPSQANYNAVIAWAQSNGLTITAKTADRRSINVTGSVAAINKAFDVTLMSYFNPATQEIFFAPDREPTLDLLVQLLAVSGLTQGHSFSPLSAASPQENRQVSDHGTIGKPELILRLSPGLRQKVNNGSKFDEK
jgi:hypothetical protein